MPYEPITGEGLPPDEYADNVCIIRTGPREVDLPLWRKWYPESKDPEKPGFCAQFADDPHATTFDQVRYDLQAAGEFVGIESVDDALEVQYRLVPVGQPPRVSYITAAAARVGDRRIVFDVRDSGRVRMGGEAVDLADGRMRLLTEDALLVRDGDTYSIVWPDGTNLHVAFYRRHLNAFFIPSVEREGKLVGLFGDADGDPANDFRTREGSLLPAPPPFSTLYETFAESWRVRPGESLFDYAPGESTDTFTDRSVPVGPATVGDLPAANRERAEAACRAAGITEPEILEDCIIDVGFSGDESFIRSARDRQRPAMLADPPPDVPEPIASGACRTSAATIPAATWRSDAARTGRFESAPGPLAGEAAWTARDFRSGHVPLVVDDRVIAARERALVALDAASGGELWSAAGPGSRIAGQGLVAAGGAVFAAWEDALAAYDLAGGTECWRLPIGRPTAAAYADGRLYVSVDEGETGWVAAVDAVTGQILWRTDARNVAPSLWPSPTAPAVGGDLVFVGDGSEVVAIERASGAVRWRSRTGGNIAAGVSFADGVVYVPGQDRGLHALDAGSGTARWTFVEPGVGMGSPVAVAGDRVFVADDQHLHALSRATGEEVWRIDAERTLRFGAPVVAGNRLVAINHQGELVVFDPATGAEVRRVPVVDPVVYGDVAPTVGAGGLFFVLSNAVLYGYR